MAQLKTLLLIAALFIVSSIAASPCKPGYKQKPNCMADATDPAKGNCWWGYDTQSCIEIYASSSAQCADYCSSCLTCVYNYGCCTEGNPSLYQQCYSACVVNI